MKRWEYWIMELNITSRWSPKRQKEEVCNFLLTLNEAGAQGWEMIEYQSVPMTSAFSPTIKGYLWSKQ